MIGKSTLTKIATLLGLKQADVDAAIAATTDVELEIPDGITVLSVADLATRDKAKYDAGGAAKLEMFIKEQKATHGLEFDGKDPAKFLEAYSAKVLADAGKAPDEAIKQKEADIKKLQKTISEHEKKITELGGQLESTSTMGEVMRAVPANLRDGMDAEEVLTLMQAKGYKFEKRDGKVVVTKDGELVADNKLAPLAIGEVIKSYATERNWLDIENGGAGKDGRGEGHSGAGKKGKTGAVPSKLSEAEAAWTAEGKNVGTADFQRHVEELSTANKNFDFDN